MKKNLLLVIILFFVTFDIFPIYVPKNKLRPSSTPHISGDTFRNISDHIIDETYLPFDPKKVLPGDIVFVAFEFMKQFFETFHSAIPSPYILITHNEDCSAPKNFLPFLDDKKIIVWFSQNGDIDYHDKFIHIPIGLSNKHWAHSHNHGELIEKTKRWIQTTNPLKKILLYGNFSIQTNAKIRKPIYDYFKTKPFCYFRAKLSQQNYLKDLAQSKFALCPHGNGLDCHRLWESLHMGCFPVVKASTLDRLYKDLPVLIVQSWDQVTEKFLEQEYAKMSLQKYNLDKLYFQHWYDLIMEFKINNQK